MMHRDWSSIVEVPYCFSRSYVKFQGHTALNIIEFDPNWTFPDSNSSLNSPMAMKCCTKLETAKERCPIVFQGHPSNFKVTRDKTSPILTQIGRFRTIGRSQLSNPSDLPCFIYHAENHILWICMIYSYCKTKCQKKSICKINVLCKLGSPYYQSYSHVVIAWNLQSVKYTTKLYEIPHVDDLIHALWWHLICINPLLCRTHQTSIS